MVPGAHATSSPEKPAVVMAGSGEQLTYAQLDEHANRLSQVLRSAGLAPGDHVALCLGNEPSFLPVMWGAHYAGLYYTALSTRLTVEEMAYIVADCGAKAVIVSGVLGGKPAALSAVLPRDLVRLAVGTPIEGFESYDDALAGASCAPLDVRVEGQDMLYSSGTTGRPKGVQLPLPAGPFGGPDASTLQCQALFGVDSDTVYLSPAPLYHAAPLRFCRAVHRSGGTVVLMEHFDPEEFLRSVEQHKVTFTQVVPTMFIRLLKLPASVRSRYDLSSLQAAVHAAAPCPVEVKRQMIEWWGPILHEYYGGTEGNGLTYCTSEEWLAHPGTVGRAVSATVHILDDDGEPLPPGEPGTVYFANGPGFSYHNDADKTRAALDPRGRGWSTLGDVGYLDEDGYLHLTDRKAYVIITGGVNVYPQEAEHVLAVHPKVADVAVFGVPHEEFGEEVKAVVQPADPDEAGPELERELIEYCLARLADVKCPRSVDFRDELPRDPSGKLYKRLLKDAYWLQTNSKATGHAG